MSNYFKVKEHGSTVRTEIMAGVTTFMAMAYILMVNAGMFASLGTVSYGAIYIATAISAVIGTVLIGAAITPVSRHGANFIRIIADRPPLSRGGRQPQLTAEDLAVVEPVSSCTFTVWDTAFSISAWSTHPAAPLRAIGSVSTAPMALPATPYTTKIRLNTTASPSC